MLMRLGAELSVNTCGVLGDTRWENDRRHFGSPHYIQTSADVALPIETVENLFEVQRHVFAFCHSLQLVQVDLSFYRDYIPIIRCNE